MITICNLPARFPQASQKVGQQGRLLAYYWINLLFPPFFAHIHHVRLLPFLKHVFPQPLCSICKQPALFLRPPLIHTHLTLSFLASLCSHTPLCTSFSDLPEVTHTLHPPSWRFLHSNQKLLFVLNCIKMQNSEILGNICQLHKSLLCTSLSSQSSSSRNTLQKIEDIKCTSKLFKKVGAI